MCSSNIFNTGTSCDISENCKIQGCRHLAALSLRQWRQIIGYIITHRWRCVLKQHSFCILFLKITIVQIELMYGINVMFNIKKSIYRFSHPVTLMGNCSQFLYILSSCKHDPLFLHLICSGQQRGGDAWKLGGTVSHSIHPGSKF